MSDILFEQRGSTACATFNRPEERNAFRRATFAELSDWLTACAADESVRALVISGAGRAFSAGIDLHEMAELIDSTRSGALDQAGAAAYLDLMQQVTRQMLDLPKPVIAALNGPAVGVGAEIAIASDIRIASTSAWFAFAEVQRGLFETNGVMYRLPRLVGLGRAAHLLLTGERLPAEEALAAGLVTRVVPPEELQAVSLQTAQALGANAPIPMRLVKRLLNQTYDLDLESMLRLEVDGMLACLRSADMREGVQAFAEKRDPQYKGY